MFESNVRHDYIWMILTFVNMWLVYSKAYNYHPPKFLILLHPLPVFMGTLLLPGIYGNTTYVCRCLHNSLAQQWVMILKYILCSKYIFRPLWYGSIYVILFKARFFSIFYTYFFFLYFELINVFYYRIMYPETYFLNAVKRCPSEPEKNNSPPFLNFPTSHTDATFAFSILDHAFTPYILTPPYTSYTFFYLPLLHILSIPLCILLTFLIVI